MSVLVSGGCPEIDVTDFEKNCQNIHPSLLFVIGYLDAIIIVVYF